MPQSAIELTIKIEANPARVWGVFTNPALTKQLGGEYVTDWQVGSTIGWKDEGGVLRTRGEILEIESEKRLTHSLLMPVTPDEGTPSTLHSTITYHLSAFAGYTKLSAREDFPAPLSDQAYADAERGWRNALQVLKMLAEKG